MTIKSASRIKALLRWSCGNRRERVDLGGGEARLAQDLATVLAEQRRRTTNQRGRHVEARGRTRLPDPTRNRVIVFFDRESRKFDKEGHDVELSWKRWKKEARPEMAVSDSPAYCTSQPSRRGIPSHLNSESISRTG